MKRLLLFTVFSYLYFNAFSQIVHFEKARMYNANFYETTAYFDSLFAIGSTAQPQAMASSTNSNNSSTNSSFLNKKKYFRWKNYWKTRVDEDGKFDTEYKAMNNLANGIMPFNCTSEKVNNIKWKALGPFNSDGAGNYSNYCGLQSDIPQNQGRIDPVAPHPNIENVILCGTRNGGIFKTIDGGNNWYNTTDAQNYSVFGVTKIAWHPTANNIVYAATGNKDGGAGIGLLVSTDFGESWSRTNLQFNPNHETVQIIDIAVHPQSTINNTLAYALVYGKVRNSNFSEGSSLYMLHGSYNDTWVEIDTMKRFWSCHIRHDGSRGNLEFNKGMNQTLYLWTSGGMKSYEKSIASAPNILPSFINLPPLPSNLPHGLSYNDLDFLEFSTDYNGDVFAMGRFTDMPANPNDCYTNPTPPAYSILFKLNGTVWDIIQTYSDLVPLDLCFLVNPYNSNIMYYSKGTCIKRSIDGGLNFTDVVNNDLHVDVRSITMQTINGHTKWYTGNDGGVGKSTDGINWHSINGYGLNIGQFYGLGLSEAEPHTVLLGAQDGSINLYKNGTWIETRAPGDNFDAMIDPRNNGVYHEQSNYFYKRMTNYGASSSGSFNPIPNAKQQFIPFAFATDPNNPDRLIAGWSDLYENTNNGSGAWTKITEAIVPYYFTSYPKISNIVICSSNSNITYYTREGVNYENNINGGIFKLERQSNGTYIQTDISGSLREINNGTVSGPLKGNQITDIAVDPKNANRIWVSLGNFNKKSPKSKVYYTNDGGNTWINYDYSKSLGNFPVNTIVYQEGSNDRLYVGTDIGVFYKDNDDTSCWTYYGDLPHTQIRELDINYCTQSLYAATWCKGLYEAPLISDYVSDFTIINNNTTWNTDKSLKNNLLIQRGATLRLDDMTLSMPKNARIIVTNGGRLEVSGSVITNACGETWRGIEVNGLGIANNPSISDVLSGNYPSTNPSTAQWQQGVLLIDNGSTIENADNAVMIMSKNENYDHIQLSGGGIVLAKNSTFKNNRRSVEIMRYIKDYSITTFENCHFIVDDNSLYESFHTLQEGLRHQFTMWDVHGVDILGCKFIDKRTDIDLTKHQNTKTIGGILSIDADYTLRSYTTHSGYWKRAFFENMYSAVRSIKTTETMGNIRIDEVDILNATYGICLKATNNAMVVRNNVFGSTKMGRTIANVKFEAMSGYNFTENKLKGGHFGFWGLNVGSQPGANIYNNEIKDNIQSGVALSYDNDHTQILCNKFLNNASLDLYLTMQVANQGQSNFSSGNKFSVATPHGTLGNITGAIHDYNLTNTIDYYHNPATNQSPEIVSSGIHLIPVPGEDENTCPTRQILVNDSENNSIADDFASLYHSALSTGVLPSALCQQYPLICLYNEDLWVEYALDELIFYELKEPKANTGDDRPKQGVLNIIELLENYAPNTPYRKTQLASYYTIAQEYGKAQNLLDSLLQDTSTNQEWKNLAQIYTIKNTLESENKSWFDIDTNHLQMVSQIASQENHQMATRKARNILELIKGIYYPEPLPVIENTAIAIPTDSSATSNESLFDIYPNPISNVLHIHCTQAIATPYTIKVYSLTNNQKVFETTMSSSSISIDAQNWDNGFYTIVILNTEGNTIYTSPIQVKN